MIAASISRILPRLRAALGCLAMAGLGMAPLRAGEVEAARRFLLRGEYEKVVATATERMAKQPDETEWPLLLGEAQTELGRYAEARATLVRGMERFPSLPRLRLAAVEALRATGAVKEAKKELEPLDPQRGGGRRYGTAAEIVARGRAALLFGTDPKIILEQLYDPARKAQPDLRDSYLACGDLALEKGDSALAAKTFANAVKKFPEDADAWYGLARAYAPSDGEAMRAALEKVFAFNERHVGGWLLVAENQIDAENYPEAETALAAARKFWRENPAVPHLVGRKLSQKYRFAEGAALQREALKFDPQYLPAKAQLAQDLLRLGKNDEGWKLADEVQQADPYDVVAFNLTTLRDALAKFRTLTSEHFAVRMDPREADIYGAEAKAPLQKLIALYPEQHEEDSAYALLARVHCELGETDAELAMLNKVVTLCDDAPDACARLIELAIARKDWRAVIANAERFAAINPLIPAPHRSAAEAHEALGETTAAIASYRTLLRLDPPNPAEFHYRLARLLHTTGDTAAKREVHLALEETPRFRAALDLLLALDEGKTSKPAKP